MYIAAQIQPSKRYKEKSGILQVNLKETVKVPSVREVQAADYAAIHVKISIVVSFMPIAFYKAVFGDYYTLEKTPCKSLSS
jgi:hypothetical protein